MARRRIALSIFRSFVCAPGIGTLAACGAANVVDIRSEGPTPDSVDVVGGDRLPDITVPPTESPTRTAEIFQDASLGSGWGATLVSIERLTDAELQGQFPNVPALAPDKQYLLALLQQRYSGTQMVGSTNEVVVGVVDQALQPLFEPCNIPLAELVSPVEVPTGSSAVLFRCFVVARDLSADAVLAMRVVDGTEPAVRFSLNDATDGSRATPRPMGLPFAVGPYEMNVITAARTSDTSLGEPMLVRIIVTIEDREPGATGSVQIGVLSPQRGALAATNCNSGAVERPGSTTASAAGDIEMCVTDRTGTGRLVGWVHSAQSGEITFFAIDAS
jgi:hypothetical protein